MCNGSYFGTISWRSCLVIDLCFMLLLLYAVLLKKENRFVLPVCESVDICSLLHSFPCTVHPRFSGPRLTGPSINQPGSTGSYIEFFRNSTDES